MQNNYRIFHRRQDIGKRISMLHREEQLSVALIAHGSFDEITASLAQAVQTTSRALYVLMHDEQGRTSELQAMFPDVAFIVFPKPVLLGTAVNAMANECYTTFFLVSRTDVGFVSYDEQALLAFMRRSDHPVVAAPLVSNKSGEFLPIVQVPSLRTNRIEPLPFFPDGTPQATLYPFQGLGCYERALFQRLRGYDEQIFGEYWQTVDLGLRCWLYGYRVMVTPTVSLRYGNRQSVIEDRSDVEGVKRCHTKALCVRQIAGKNLVRRWSGLTDPRVMHGEVKKRVALYKTDYLQLMDQWNAPEESRP